MKYLFAISLLIGAVSCLEYKYADDKVEQLCKSEPTVECLREVIGKRGDCARVEKPEASVHYSSPLLVTLPNFGLTVIIENTEFSNLGAVKVEQAIFDKTIKSYRLTLNFDNATCHATKALTAVKMPNGEPDALAEDITAYYPFRMDIEIPSDSNKKISTKNVLDATCTAYVEGKEDPTFVFGPKLANGNDKNFNAALGDLVKNVPVGVKEILWTKCYYYMVGFLDTQICKFDGLKPESYFPFNPHVLRKIADNYGDKEETKEHICKDSEELEACVSDFIKKNGDGKDASPPEGGSWNRKHFDQYIPSLNIISHTMDVKYTVTGDITHAYVNKKTNNFVLCVDFKGIQMQSSRVPTTLRHLSKGPKKYVETNSDVYPGQACITISLDNGITAKSIREAYVSFDFSEAPTYGYTQASEYEDDPDVQEINKAFEDEPIRYGNQIMMAEERCAMIAYIQQYLANFDIKLDNHIGIE